MRITLIFQLLMLQLSVLTAQSIERSVYATAGNFSRNKAQISWTIGESFGTSFQKENVQVTQGFQQGKAKVIGPKQETKKEIKIKHNGRYKNRLTAFPNPFEARLAISIELEDSSREKELTVELLNINGQLIYRQNQTISGTQIKLDDLADLPSGPYFVRISNSTTVLGNLRIIKN